MLESAISTEQYIYCSNICPIGKLKKEQFLADCESAADAAFDMHLFVTRCYKTCNIMKNWEGHRGGVN